MRRRQPFATPRIFFLKAVFFGVVVMFLFGSVFVSAIVIPRLMHERNAVHHWPKVTGTIAESAMIPQQTGKPSWSIRAVFEQDGFKRVSRDWTGPHLGTRGPARYPEGSSIEVHVDSNGVESMFGPGPSLSSFLWPVLMVVSPVLPFIAYLPGLRRMIRSLRGDDPGTPLMVESVTRVQESESDDRRDTMTA